MTRPTGWRSYDSVAPEYERLTPALFGRLADDLVELLGLAPPARVLDAGTGTGTSAAVIGRCLGPEGTVLGVDPSLGMLSRARGRASWIVAGMLPALPLADQAFDAVVANLVLSHLRDVQAGMDDLVRVTRPGGRIGVTAWPEDRDAPDNDAPKARRLIETELDEAGFPLELPEQGAPAEEWLKDQANLEAVLSNAGLRDVKLEVRAYRYQLTPAEYVGWHAWAGRGRYLRSLGDDVRLRGFERRASRALADRFPSGIRLAAHARLATGTRPG
jgi:SAM-dependent methyltransferase